MVDLQSIGELWAWSITWRRTCVAWRRDIGRCLTSSGRLRAPPDGASGPRNTKWRKSYYKYEYRTFMIWTKYTRLPTLFLWIFVILWGWSNQIIDYSNMTWFFSPIESMDTNCALLAHKAALFHSRESPFRESVLLSVFWVPWVKLGHY